MNRKLIFPLLAALSLLVACGSGGSSLNPLVTEYTVNAPVGSSVSVEFGTDTSYGLSTWSVPAPAGGGNVTIEVAGMRPSTTYHMRARTVLADGSTVLDPDRTFTTGSVETSRFPTFTVTGDTTPGRGVEMINLTSSPSEGVGNKVQAIVTDLKGNLIWYYDHASSEGFAFASKLLPNGHMLVDITDFSSTGVLREVDLEGRTIRELTLSALNQSLSAHGYKFSATYFHHDMVPLPNGHTILLVALNKDFQNLTGYPGTTTVEGDALIDLDENFNPVWVWNAFDYLDVNRHPMNFPPDWTHSNAVLYTPDGNLLLSMRHQSWIVKIDYEDGKGSGKVLWKLGYQGNFTLTNGGPSDWFYGQHYPSIISTNGSIMRLAVFDDGNNRVLDTAGDVCGTTGNPDCYTRATIYDVDQSTMTATLVWAYKPGFFTLWGGSINQLVNGNVEFDMPAPNSLPGSRIMEVTQTPQPASIWQMDLSVPTAYRGYRIPSLYPGVQW